MGVLKQHSHHWGPSCATKWQHVPLVASDILVFPQAFDHQYCDYAAFKGSCAVYSICLYNIILH